MLPVVLPDQFRANQKHVLVTTLEQNMSKYTKREVKGALLAKQFRERMGLMSSRDAYDMIHNGMVQECPITTHDVYRESATWTRSLGDLKGKEVRQTPDEVKVEYTTLGARMELVLHVDIMFVQGVAFFICVATPLGMMLCVHLPDGRSTTSIRQALKDVIIQLRTRNFVPTCVLSDGEGALSHCMDIMSPLGLTFNPAGPGQHVPVVERAIRTLKSKARGILNTLPYRLPMEWLQYLISFVVNRMNWMPNRHGQGWHSPKEMFNGVKFNYKRDCRIGFGEYVQAYKPQQILNTMNERTEGAISLVPTGSLSGSVKFMCLRTLKPIVRTQWTVLPIPQVLAEFINALSRREKSKGHVGQDPVFSRGDTEVDEVIVIEDDDEPDDMPEGIEMEDRNEVHIPMNEDEEEYNEDNMNEDEDIHMPTIAPDDMVRELEPDLEQEQLVSVMEVDQPDVVQEVSQLQ